MPLVQSFGLICDKYYDAPIKYPRIKCVEIGTKLIRLFSRNGKRLASHSQLPLEIFGNLTPVLILTLLTIPSAAFAMPLSNNDFQKLAAQCAPDVSSTTLEAVARVESGLNPWILHDDTTGQKDSPHTLSDATTMLKQWVLRGDSVDIGLMQINSANLNALGITTTAALDPCISLSGGATILQAAYGGGATPAEQQVALLMALSRYNTGSPFKGIMNGYARTVMNNSGIAASPKLEPEEVTIPSIDPSAPPAWNVSATGIYAQIHGASWLVSLTPLPVRMPIQ